MKLLFLFIYNELIYYLISVNYSQYEPITLFDPKASHYLFNFFPLSKIKLKKKIKWKMAIYPLKYITRDNSYCNSMALITLSAWL